MKESPIIFNIAGGVGKNIMSTAIVRQLAEKFPDRKIIITSPHKDPWLNNPHISKIVDLEKEPEFTNNILKKEKATLFLQDPYNAPDFVYRKKHLIEIWCELCDLKWDGRMPELFFSEEETKKVKELMLKSPKGKPIFMIQTNGGYINQAFPISWARDLPLSIAQKIVDEMIKRGYEVIHFRRDNQWSLEGATKLPFSLREYLCAIQFTDKRLFIDSVPQHTAAAFNLPSTVCWIVNSPKVFGYEMNTNILPKIKEEWRHNPDAYVDRYNIWGTLHEHPYPNDQIFDVEEILKSLEN